MNSIIEVKNLTKKFNGSMAVNNISFNVEKGDIFAFLGPNGAGKTTTIKILTTILRQTSGEVFLNGYNVAEQPHKARSSFGIVFQDSSLDDQLTAYENMDFHGVLYGVPTSRRKKRIRELLEFVELWSRRNSLVKEFSGGMERRLEIARGLLHHPTVLFLDEPTLGLDPQTRTHIWDYIRKLSKEEGITVFFTTHYMDEVEKLAEKVAIIDYGEIVDKGTSEQLRTKTDKDNLEEAFLDITGRSIRQQKAKNTDKMRKGKKLSKK